jgi:hypothetical protein
VDSADAVNGTLGVIGSAVGGHCEEGAGALEPSPRITPIIGMLCDAGHRQRMQRLQQQCPQAADENRCVGVYPPDWAVLGEPARARGVMDARPVRGAVWSRDHTEQTAAQRFPQARQLR